MIQNPAAKKGTSVVVRGGKGVGKTKFSDWISRLFKRKRGTERAHWHVLSVSKRAHVTGNFNSHLTECLFLIGEEAFWAGDKQAEGTLKDLITGHTLSREQKGQDVVSVDNHVHLWQIANAEWVVPATADERRFFVLVCADTRQNDTDFFAAIDAQMNAGGLEAMMQDLSRLQVPPGINLRNPPRTAGLLDQIAAGLSSVERWLCEAVESGGAYTVKAGLRPQVQGDFLCAEVYGAYRTWCSEQPVRAYAENSNIFGRQLAKCGIKRVRRVGCEGRKPVYIFPALEVMEALVRARFGVGADDTHDAGGGAYADWAAWGRGEAGRP